jgi:enamine deaminase RidA (YjgF/YER057c/UK114 family)
VDNYTGAEPAASSGSALVGQLSAADSGDNPNHTVQTERLIQSTETLLKKVSPQRQAQHKDDVAQVNSFLAQAKQALNMNDLVGAQTLANKAKIMVDELLK